MCGCSPSPLEPLSARPVEPADDPAVAARLAELYGPLEAYSEQEIGSSAVQLDGERQTVRNEETNLGGEPSGSAAPCCACRHSRRAAGRLHSHQCWLLIADATPAPRSPCRRLVLFPGADLTCAAVYEYAVQHTAIIEDNPQLAPVCLINGGVIRASIPPGTANNGTPPLLFTFA